MQKSSSTTQSEVPQRKVKFHFRNVKTYVGKVESYVLQVKNEVTFENSPGCTLKK